MFLESGKFNADTHSQFLRLIGTLREGLPSLVIQDCPAFHKTDEVLDSSEQANIFLLGIPSNSSWWLQQADDLPFLLNKNEHYRRVREFTLNLQRAPNLFETCKIYLDSRRDVLTPEVIISSFKRVGQYDHELKSPSKRAILAKARDARLRCSGTDTWVEVDEMRRPLLDEIQKNLDNIDLHLQETIDSLQRVRTSILENQRQSRGQINPSLVAVMAKERETRKMRAKIDDLTLTLALTEAEREVQEQAALPIPEDPEIVALWEEKKNLYRASDLSFLKAQSVLLTNQITSLIPAAKESKDTEAGKLLQKGKNVIGLPRQLAHRKVKSKPPFDSDTSANLYVLIGRK